MQNFDWTQFTRKIPVKAPMQTLYNAWAKPSEIKKWFLREADYTDEYGRVLGDDEIITAGCNYAWQWYCYDVTEHGKIIRANGRDQIQFTFAGECIVEIQLTPEDDEVIVSLTQKNIPTDETSMRDIRLGCHSGWSFFLVNLKSVYEGGLDLRNRKENGSGMVNS